MSYSLILLGLLAEQPRYGYELKQTIEQRNFAEYVRLSGGGLYYTLRKLCDDGDIEEQTVEREGNYPDRHTYRITEQGRERFQHLLRNTLEDLAGRRFYDPVDAALAFSGTLDPAEVVARLRRQADQVRPRLTQLRALHELQAALIGYVDLYSRLIVDHAIHRLAASLEWLETVSAQIEATAARAPEQLRPDAGVRDRLTAQTGLAPDTLAAILPPFGEKFGGIAHTGYGNLRAAEAAYQRSIESAWSVYESHVRAYGPQDARTQVAYQEDQRQVAAAWQACETRMAGTKETVLAQFAQTAQALDQALAEAGADEDTNEGVQP
jgi:DNA-binding PadR family transcriptional regulator